MQNSKTPKALICQAEQAEPAQELAEAVEAEVEGPTADAAMSTM